MFKKLRNKLLILNMAMTSLVMIAAFIAVYLTTYNNIQQDNQGKLEQMLGTRIMSFTNQGQASTQGEHESVTSTQNEAGASFISADYSLSFSVEVDAEGEFLSVDSFIDIPMETYFEAAAAAWANKDSGNTLDFADKLWLFSVNPIEIHITGQDGFRTISGDRYSISFLDITDSQKTLDDLLMTFLFVALGVFAAIFAISLYFANRTIKPISKTWEKQRQFVADASHELKTPLSVIMANYDVLMDNKNETIASQMEWFEYIKFGTDKMSGLIGDMLSLAKAEGVNGNQFERQSFDISAAIMSETKAMEAAAAKKGIHLEYCVNPGIIVNCNEEAARRVFAILLDNAVKYANEDGRIEIALRAEKKRVVCTVKNTGDGIDEADLGRIFDKFYRADKARSGTDGGYGLGLPIAKAIMDGLEGEIAARCEADGTTTFTVSFNLS